MIDTDIETGFQQMTIGIIGEGFADIAHLHEDAKRLSLIRDRWQSAFAIELVFDLAAAVANWVDRTLRIVF